MPPISDEAPAGGKPIDRLGFAGLPDRDNPFAWKQKTREGKLGARDLLTVLTDDEVARYATVVQDQVSMEERYAAIKIASAVCGLGLAAAAIWHGIGAGISKLDAAGLGLAALMVYWPWRVLTCRALWIKHLKAAKAELARRSGA
jgi:hypothetical protein